MTDSHCHLDGKRYDEDRAAVIERALAAGVTRMMSIGTGDGPPDLEVAVRVADQYEPVYATVGVHPHDADKVQPEHYTELAALLQHPKVLALGEIGLDYHYDFSPRDVQKEVFLEQMRVAADAKTPIVIHTREAWEDTLDLLEQHWMTTGLGGIMHCFSGGPEEAQRCVELGFHLAFGGMVTFPKLTDVQEAARVCPADRLLVETDAPYLAPVPHRGKRNEPGYVVHSAAKIAELRGVDVAEIDRVTTDNFERLFNHP